MDVSPWTLMSNHIFLRASEREKEKREFQPTGTDMPVELLVLTRVDDTIAKVTLEIFFQSRE